MKTNWMHIEFWFTEKSGYCRNDGLSYVDSKRFKQLLRICILKNIRFFNRKFYLFEPNPHCFLAFEIKSQDVIKNILREFNFIKSSYLKSFPFVKKMEIKLNTTDQDNKDGFLNILDSFTDFNLLKQDNSLSHIIHCCIDNSFLSRKEERKFYQYMFNTYLLYGRKK